MYNPTKPYKREILKLIRKTWRTPYVRVEANTYPIIKKRFTLAEVQHTDGIGTKGYYHWRKRTFRNAVLDALAMNLNDLALVGAVPYALQNHIVLPKDDHAAILEIIQEIMHECRKRNIAMTGGETSIHNNADSLDISMTVSGFIKYPRQNRFRVGDVLIGLKSNGLHSNGFTKVRELFGNTTKPEFTVPTTIYSEEILSLLAKHSINGMMHVTGGAFTKLKDLLAKNTDVTICHTKKLQPQHVFFEMFRNGVSHSEMYKTFNCGVGFVISAPRKDAQRIVARMRSADIIGEIVKGNGSVIIKSAFGNRTVRL